MKAQGLGGVGGGTGLLIARRKDGGWSAPIAVGGMSVSAGTAAGVKMTDSMILLMDPAEVQNFSGVGVILNQGVSAGVSVGTESAGMAAGYQAGTKSASMAAGASVGSKSVGGGGQVTPGKLNKALSRSSSLEVDRLNAPDSSSSSSFNSSYTYSKTLGFHAGATGHGGFMTIQHAINCMFYGRRVKLRKLLTGEVPQPEVFKYFYESIESLSGTKPSPCYPKEGLFPMYEGETLADEEGGPDDDDDGQGDGQGDDEEKETTDGAELPQPPLLSPSSSDNPLQPPNIVASQNEVVVAQSNTAVKDNVSPKTSSSSGGGGGGGGGWFGGIFSKKEVVYEQDRQIVVEWDMSNPNTAKRLHPTYELTVHDSKGPHTRSRLRFRVFRALFQSLGKLKYGPPPFPPTHTKSGFGMRLTQKQLDGRIRMLLVWLGELEANSDLLTKSQRKKYEKFLYGADGK
eukprot:CAMPEP_0114373454 /NCGR_PEP_ID=MMETSP0101-20121206/34880_1 /TAXON_ID=38822 ORGANISM="Pteridomonas danica, Strain PT" /NCGR_SAMPLE_ID=MMETSP0101 /ASSEMBLY_ACC=CAM_ASM_000211 /LENGTH=456 /DNA_ID=CAMNT_0001526707 /DNA_START=245 /DNA_END=1615 /DNA_ORIENTATION=+